MNIAEVIVNEQAAKPLSPEQARVRSMKQGIARQKATLAVEKERQQNAKYTQKISKLRTQASA